MGLEVPRDDYRDARDAKRRERLVHLEQRRQGGAPLVGGRSEARTGLSSTSGLAETETIAAAAVTATTIVEDSNPIASAAAVNTYEFLIEVEIVGAGYPVSVKFTDHYTWSGVATGYISYRLQLVDANNVVQSTHEQVVSDNNTFNWNTWTHPDITVVADLTEGVVYRAQVHVFRQTGFAWNSRARRFVITDLKR